MAKKLTPKVKPVVPPAPERERPLTPAELQAAADALYAARIVAEQRVEERKQ